MGWIHDDFDFDPDDEYGAPSSMRERLTGFFIGLAVGVLTLVLVAALIVTTVGTYFLNSRVETARPALRSAAPPTEADLRAANYRPSEWIEVDTRQAIIPTPLPPEIISQADIEHALLINLYLRVNPSVVNIEIVSSIHTTVDVVDSSGSGFVYDTAGHIVTNAHVVRGAREILVTFSDGYVLNAELVAVDDYSDLAVIRVDPARAPLVPVLLGDSNQLQVGQRVIAIGNPFGLDGSMTVGIVSALGRTLPSARLLDPVYDQYSNPSIIQVDAAVNPGNSGGPLLDSYGQVIGINTAIRTENGGFQGIAFAVPVNTMKRIVPQLITKGSVQYSWLGITSPAADGGYSVAALADELNLPVRNGILVSDVTPSSPAARAGLRAGTQTTTIRGMPIPTDADIIVAVNGQMVRDIDSLVAYLVENTSPGDTITLTIVRGGQTLDLDVTLGIRP
ncbi:MAG: trypsin-like peptidase domain-containing protein [Anaerolineae bacterium]|nr:trypsin-like peptidase domain-containing protein [Anaerolineae bacterium]